MSKGFKGLIATIIALVAAVAFFVGFVATGAGGGSKTVAETVASGADEGGTAGGSDTVETIKDSAGNEFKIPLEADSVITLNPNGADMLTALGKESLITGVSNDTKYPASTVNTKRYGTESSPDTENIIAAKPGAVIATADFATSAEYAKLKQAGIPVVCLNLNNADTAVEESAKLGLLFDAYDKADEFVTDLENVKSLVSEKVAGKEEKKVYWEKNDDFTSVNKDGNENRIITLATAKSITADKTEAEVKTDAAFVQSGNPDVIVKTSDYDKNILTLENENLQGAEAMVDGIKKRSGFETVPAVKDNRIVILSDRITNTPLGSAIAPLYVAKAAHPEDMQDVVPGQYLNEFLTKYWSSADLKGSLAYLGDISVEENANTNSLAAGSTAVGGGSLLSSLASSNASLGTDLRSSLVSTSSPAADAASSSATDAKLSLANKAGVVTNTQTQNKTSTNNKNAQAKKDTKQNDLSTSNDKENIKDSAGQQIVVDKEDGNTGIRSCIVFNSSVYEMIKIMGGQNTVIGVADSLATSSDFPELAGKKTFGKWNEPNAEAIIEAKPDVVFAYADYGQEAMQKVRAAGITVVSLNFYVPSEIDDEIITLGKIFGNEALAKEWNKDVDEIQSIVSARTKYLSRATCYWETYSDYSSVADGSGGAEILTLAGVHNLYDKASAASYPKVSDEWVIQKNPDVVVKICSSTTTSASYCMGTTVHDYSLASAVYSKIAGRTGWSEINAVKDRKILLLHSKVGTTAFGCAVAPLYVAKVAYPDKFADIDADSYARAFYKKYWGTDLTGTWRFSYQKLN